MPTSHIDIWIQAARPKTLWAAVAPILIGSTIAYDDGLLHVPAALAALAAALLIQIGTNFCNDYADFKKGADTDTRTGPLRLTQAGLVSPRAMLRATFIAYAAAFVAAGYLVWRCGWPLAVLILVCIVAGVLYTAGPRPYGYMGLGDLFALVFFGPVAVTATYFVQTLRFDWAVVFAGLGPGLMAVAILVVNNLRDIEDDARAGKRTLAVRFGKNFTRIEYLLCLLGAAAVPLVLYLCALENFYSILAMLIVPASWPALRRVFSSKHGTALNPALAHTARMMLLYGILFSIGWLM